MIVLTKNNPNSGRRSEEFIGPDTNKKKPNAYPSKTIETSIVKNIEIT